MTTATLTSKGQITIPKKVRDSLRLHAGDQVEFVIRGDSEVSFKPITLPVDRVFGMLGTAGQSARSAEEMKEAVARRFRSRPT